MLLEIEKDNIWNYYHYFPIAITTNGNVNCRGCNVMGKGIALEAKRYCPALPKMIGDSIKRIGNRVKYFPEYNLFSFPTKHDWREKSDIQLISESAYELYCILTNANWFKEKIVYMTRPGCGNGQLDWLDIKPIMEDYFKNSECCIFIVNK